MGRTGNLHIVYLDRKADTYSVSFTSYASGGGAPGGTKIHGRDGLKRHLLGMSIHEDIIERALQDAQREGKSDIPKVRSNG